jgi:methyl halide transferase
MNTNWEQHYLDNHTPWDKGAPAPPLLEWAEKNSALLQGKILVPGCGTGHDVRALATLPGVDHVLGLDISPSAVEAAQRKDSGSNANYEVADLFHLPPRFHEAYDWVWEHTCFCAIDPAMRDDYVEAVHGALKPGGYLLGVFYLDPYDNDHQPNGGPPHGSTESEIVSRFTDSGKFELVESYVPAQSYPGREGLELVLRFRKSS